MTNTGSACISAGAAFEGTCDTTVLWKSHHAQTLSAHATAYTVMSFIRNVNKRAHSDRGSYAGITSFQKSQRVRRGSWSTSMFFLCSTGLSPSISVSVAVIGKFLSSEDIHSVTRGILPMEMRTSDPSILRKPENTELWP